MSVFALKDFYILSEDLSGEYVRKIRLYKDYYDALGRFVVLNDDWFEISFYLAAYFEQVDEPDMDIEYAAQSVIHDLVYDTKSDVLGSTAYTKPSNLMTAEKRRNIEALFDKHQAMRKAQYESQDLVEGQERVFYALHTTSAAEQSIE